MKRNSVLKAAKPAPLRLKITSEWPEVMVRKPALSASILAANTRASACALSATTVTPLMTKLSPTDTLSCVPSTVAVPPTVRIHTSRGCGVPLKVTVVANSVCETAVTGVAAGAGAKGAPAGAGLMVSGAFQAATAAAGPAGATFNGNCQALPSRLTSTSCVPSASAVTAAGPLLLINAAKALARFSRARFCRTAGSGSLPNMPALTVTAKLGNRLLGPARLIVHLSPITAVVSIRPTWAIEVLPSTAKPLAGVIASCGVKAAPVKSLISTRAKSAPAAGVKPAV